MPAKAGEVLSTAADCRKVKLVECQVVEIRAVGPRGQLPDAEGEHFPATANKRPHDLNPLLGRILAVGTDAAIWIPSRGRAPFG